MINDMYTLAVVIPCWNEEVLLPRMLDCIIKQTFSDWKAFCVDDGSSDHTADVIRMYASRDNRIKYLRRERAPKGGQTCRNIGLDYSQGAKYVVFLDADDIIAPYCFQQRVSYMESHPHIDVCSFPTLAFSNDIYEEYGPVFGCQLFDDNLVAMLNFNVPYNTGSDIFRRDCLINYQLRWDDNVLSWQDVAFHVDMITSGMVHAFDTQAKVDYFYAYSPTGVAVHIKSTKHFKSHLYLIQKVSNQVSHKYGHNYDFYLESFIVIILGTIRKDLKTCLQLLDIPWVKTRKEFRLKLILYILTFRLDRRFIFKKYRKYSKQSTAEWNKSVYNMRSLLIRRGYYY